MNVEMQTTTRVPRTMFTRTWARKMGSIPLEALPSFPPTVPGLRARSMGDTLDSEGYRTRGMGKESETLCHAIQGGLDGFLAVRIEMEKLRALQAPNPIPAERIKSLNLTLPKDTIWTYVPEVHKFVEENQSYATVRFVEAVGYTISIASKMQRAVYAIIDQLDEAKSGDQAVWNDIRLQMSKVEKCAQLGKQKNLDAQTVVVELNRRLTPLKDKQKPLAATHADIIKAIESTFANEQGAGNLEAVYSNLRLEVDAVQEALKQKEEELRIAGGVGGFAMFMFGPFGAIAGTIAIAVKGHERDEIVAKMKDLQERCARAADGIGVRATIIEAQRLLDNAAKSMEALSDGLTKVGKAFVELGEKFQAAEGEAELFVDRNDVCQIATMLDAIIETARSYKENALSVEFQQVKPGEIDAVVNADVG